ncbi:carbohydrate kinase family protein [Candidatus Woesearchaeota archaeon]|nr:carbohydrate kinase family protein [Candidatus Woesearchaeota archaeon]
MFDVITVGSAVIDIFALTDVRVIHNYISFPLGTKMLIQQTSLSTGGGATNTAVALSRLGLKTGCISKIGCDYNGHFLCDELKKEKVTYIASTCDGTTAYSIILSSTHARDRTILTHKGITNELSFSEVPKNKLRTRWFYFCTLLNSAYTALEQLAIYAEKNKIKIAFNPTTYLVKKGPKYLQKILSKTNMLFLNREEAVLLTNTLTRNKSMPHLLKACYKLVPHIVIITDGNKGAYCYDGRYVYSIPATKVRVVETTGAGDAFTSTFLAGFIKTKNIEKSLKLALVNAQSVLQYHGAKNKLLLWEEALQESKKIKYKVKKQRLSL